MHAFARFMSEKMENKQYKRETLRDLGLAAVDSFVIFDQMARNDSKNVHLLTSVENRASQKDLNGTRPGNYLQKYLEQLTNKVKVPLNHVKQIQEAEEGFQSARGSQFDTSSILKGSTTFVGNGVHRTSGTSLQPNDRKTRLLPSLMPSDMSRSRPSFVNKMSNKLQLYKNQSQSVEASFRNNQTSQPSFRLKD